MELELHRIDLLQTSATAPGTLVVLPSGENKTQKMAVGDLSGVIQCFSIKKGEVVLSFKTLPSPHKVTAVVLGRAARQRDKIFVAAGNTVRGLTKKGKEFFRFVPALTEAVTHLDVAETHMWAGCQYVHNHFDDGADKGLYLAPDKITASELMPVPGVADWLPVIACQDCCIRIRGLDGKNLFEVATSSPPTALRYVTDQHAKSAAKLSSARELLYGCQDGRLVQLLVDAGAVRQGFVIMPPERQDIRAAVTAIHCGADYSKTGCADIVVGREDGSLEVWDIDSLGQPQLVVATQLSESITAVDGGYITSPASPDIIVQTFTGKIIAFASQPGTMAAVAEQRSLKTWASLRGSAAAAQQDLVASLNTRIARETAELAELRAKVAKERERWAVSQGSAQLASKSVVDVRHRLTRQPQDGCFVLFIEAAVPLFALAIQASVPLTLLDLPGNVAILSKTQPDAAGGNATLATYRFQEATNRLSIKFSVREGVPGTITAYIIPALPPKTCSVIEVPLHPLCMHQLVSNIGSASSAGAPGSQQGQATDAGEPAEVGQAAAGAALAKRLQETRPCSELLLQGSFSLHDVHSWLRQLLPDVPPQLPPGSSSAGHLFKCQQGSLLSCQYSAGQAQFICESVSSMAILHDSLLAAATAAKERVSMKVKLHPAALQHCVSLLWPALELHVRLVRQQELTSALQELQMQGPGAAPLFPEYQHILSGGAADASSSGRSSNGDQQQKAGSEQEGLASAIEAFGRLLKDYSRLATGATAAARQLLPGLLAMLRQPVGLTQQQVVELMSRCKEGN